MIRRRRSFYLALGLFMVAGLVAMQTAHAAEIRVPTDYSTIQAAINAAAAGDIITVAPGTYTENLVMASDITLQGEETARTFLKAAGSGPVLSIASQSNLTVRRFIFSGETTGITVSNSNTITIAGNVFAVGSNSTGILVTDNSGVLIDNNTFWSNATGVNRNNLFTEIQNNIFASNGQAIAVGFNDVGITYNCYFSNDDGLTPGTQVATGDPLLVDPAASDYHLKEGSACIDTGTGTDIIDGTVADAGAYGGQHADPTVLPVPRPVATNTSGSETGPYNIKLEWSANLSYLVTSSTNPGGYRLYYDSDTSGPPYEGTDAGGGLEPSPIDVGNVTSYTLENLTPASSVPPAPVLQSLQPSSQTLDVSWSAVAGATSYTLHYGIDSTADNRLAVGNTTSYKLTGLQNGQTYHVSVSAVSQPVYYLTVQVYDSTATKHASAYAAETSIAIGSASESIESDELTAIPESVIPYPDLPNEGCFIATAAWGYYSAPEVQALRDFRDDYLLTNSMGRAFVQWYYANSPPLAEAIRQSPLGKSVIRVLLMPLVAMAVFLQDATQVEKYTVLFLITGLLALLLRRWWYRRRPRQSAVQQAHRS